jgi:hypothetical protein
VKWFGPRSWEAPINESCERAEIPVGQLCSFCTVAIEETDLGVLIPSFVAPEREVAGESRRGWATGLVSAWSDKPMHLRCLMAETLGPTWRTMLGATIDELIERSSVGSAAWVECEQHGHQPVDPFKSGCIVCVSEAEL